MSLIKNEKFEEIIVVYPIPGHSYLDCDRDFGRIEKNKRKIEKVGFPSEWVKLIKESDKNFSVNYVNYSLTDDLKIDEKPIVSVDYKNFFEHFGQNVDQLSNIRKIKFNRNGIFATAELLSDSFNMNINLLKSNIFVDKFDFQSLKYAYNNFLSIKKLNSMT